VSCGWYDLGIRVESEPGFLRRLAGHVENGKDSASDPALGV
jgi:phospholipase C